MSSLLIIGFFALASGRRLAITKPGAKSRTWYCYYSTTIQTSTGNILPADLRIYSPINDVVHPDNTIAFVIAKAYIPPNDTTFLDVLHLAICPGDPSSVVFESPVRSGFLMPRGVNRNRNRSAFSPEVKRPDRTAKRPQTAVFCGL
ncbi:uncharacterized protein LACBIDRAFT_297814 [Laccaria bicolor S238N-H82]|uniref:Predicted protein n=1 Tax=Laccaria bicolor (strain S238N-H82 / ATCC MYA-4686) TaxID=486041 RepID=B0DAY6_LACBS|nr:uncharacterized protein LACBIDRAFT_297814 [Laccaria bicolor S238N-H82]EDR08113.1 predicted protein [Laccaria bicolor S238N-H82]|eukprot:XP_001881183.1 predicted protein [Laccaria bicolor S238N-H82]